MDKENLTARDIKQKILNLRDQIPKEEQEFAGTKVWIHGLTSYDLEGWRLVKNNSDPEISKLATAKLLQLTMRTETGERIFKENELTIIAGLPSIELEPIATIAMRLSGYGITAQADVLKNSLPTSGEGGLSEQPENTDAV